MYDRGGKRLLDLVVAAPMLLLATPVMVAVALGVLLVLGRPVLFRQRRLGRDARPFTVMKFRSMAAGDDPDGARLGRYGRALRASALDELPQLFQVLRGEMSLVGPRPLLPEDFPNSTPRQRRRVLARPGMTGLAQIAGRNAVPWDERLEFDVRYVETVTLRGDLSILLRTPVLLLAGRGVTAPGVATMTRFAAWSDRRRGD